MRRGPLHFQRDVNRAGLGVSLPADRRPGDLLLQRLRLVSVWGGWSTRWYAEILRDERHARRRIGHAAHWLWCPQPFATVLGTLAAVALVRTRALQRPWRLFSAAVYAPLVMPEVITGLSLLLLFVAVGVDRGFWTIVIAHTTVTMCFVNGSSVQARCSISTQASRRPRWISAARH